jgi:diamine N-acetyltransferase
MRLGILPEHRRHGLGALLVKHGCAEARRKGCGAVEIGVIWEHRDLVDWYARQGFVFSRTERFDHLPFTVGYMTMKLQQEEGAHG